MKLRPCELCNTQASVFCPSDNAFLCWTCDANVHEANFLVSRHLRRTLCSNCNTFTGNIVSGVGFRLRPDSSWSDALVKRRMRSKWRLNNMKAEGVFVNWCGKLGLESGSAVETACKGLRVCAERWSGLPYRVWLAASIWLGLRLGVDQKSEPVTLKRVEEISGVPANIILAVESKLETIMRRRQVEHRFRRQLQEGWDEC